MSTLKDRINSQYTKYGLAIMITEKVFSFVNKNLQETVDHYCYLNSLAHKSELKPIYFREVTYHATNEKYLTPLRLKMEFVEEFLTNVVIVKNALNYEQQLVQSYVSACLSKSSNVNVGKSYLIEALQTSATVPINVEEKQKLELNHTEAIEIIKKHLTLSLFT